jgi:hypothetical protein
MEDDSAVSVKKARQERPKKPRLTPQQYFEASLCDASDPDRIGKRIHAIVHSRIGNTTNVPITYEAEGLVVDMVMKKLDSVCEFLCGVGGKPTVHSLDALLKYDSGVSTLPVYE